MAEKKRRIRAWYFLLAALAGLAGLGGFAYVLFSGLSELSDTRIRLTVPGVTQVLLREQGKYTVFFEDGPAVANLPNQVYSVLNGLSFRVQTGLGAEVAVAPARAHSTYNLHGRYGVSLLEFEIKEPGVYVFFTSFTGPQPLQPVALTLMPGFVALLFRTILLSFCAIGGGLIGAAVFVALAFARQKEKNAAKSEAPVLPKPIE